MADNGTDSLIVAIGHGLAIKMVAPQCNVNPYSLVVAPAVRTWADLKGKPVILGTKQDVTAIVFIGMASEHKLKLDDFSIIIGGASNARYTALMSGNVAAAVLAQPFDLLAVSKGMRVLATAHDTYRDWALACTAVNVGWAANNRATVVKVLRAARRAIRFGEPGGVGRRAGRRDARRRPDRRRVLGFALQPLESVRSESSDQHPHAADDRQIAARSRHHDDDAADRRPL